MINTLTQIISTATLQNTIEIRRKNAQEDQKNKQTNKQTSKVLNVIYSNAGGIKYKTKSIKEILFETQCDIRVTETNLKDKEKVNIIGCTWIGKNRASERRGIGS